MAAAILRMLALIALVLMPVGMAGSPATAAPAPTKKAVTMMAGHCEQVPDRDRAPPPSKMDCMAMCTALPATDAPMPLSMMKPATPRSLAASAPFSGIEPDIATPPPRLV